MAAFHKDEANAKRILPESPAKPGDAVAIDHSVISHDSTPVAAPIVFQPVVTDWIVPVALLFVAAIGRKITREGRGWKSEDFFIGPDLCLVAVSTGLLRIFDLLKHLPVPVAKIETFEYEAGLGVFLLIFTFAMYLFVLSEHRDLPASEGGRLRKTRLGIICNAIGFAVLTAFIILIKPM
jgi:hypothetical protein